MDPMPPPPGAPEVPPGWVAQWNDVYKEWFYVNLATKQSQWEKPTAPSAPDEKTRPPPGPPPADERPPDYAAAGGNPTPFSPDVKQQHGGFESNNPYASTTSATRSDSGTPSGPSRQQEEEDARLARELQDREMSSNRQAPGGGYMQSGANGPRGGDGAGTVGKGKALLGKLLGKGKGKSGGAGYIPQQQQGYGPPMAGGYAPQQQGYGPPMGGGYAPQQQGYGPPMGGGYPPQQQGYGPPMMGGGYGRGGYGQPGPHGYPQQQGGRRPGGGGGGMGMMAGGAALGMGAGMIGGAMMMNSMHGNDQEAYQDGYQDGMDDGGDDDFGGGDDFGD